MSSLSMSILTSQLQLHKPMGWELSPGCSPMKPSTPLSRARSSAFVNSPFGPDPLGTGATAGGPPSMGQVGGMVPLVKLLSTAYADSVIALSASAVAGLAIDSRNAEAFKEAGGVPNLVWLLKERLCHDVTFAVLWATTALARYSGTADALRDAGGVGALLAFLDRVSMDTGDSNGDPEELAVQAAAALAELAASNDNNQEAVLDLGGLQNLERLLRSGLGRVGGVSSSAMSGLRAFKALIGRPLSRGAVRCAEALQPSHVELVLALLQAGLAGAAEVAEEAAAVLEVVSAASPVLCNTVLKAQGAVPALVGVVRAGADTPGAASAAYAIGHLAQQLGEPARAALAEEDAVDALLGIAQPQGLMPSEMLNASKLPSPAALAAAFALQQIHGPTEEPLPTPSPKKSTVSSSQLQTSLGSSGAEEVPESIPALVNLLNKKGAAGFAIVHAAGALADLALADEGHRATICDAGGIKPTVGIIRAATSRNSHPGKDQPPPALHQALRLVGGLAHSRAHASALQEAGAVPLVVEVLLGPWGQDHKSAVASSALQALRWLSDNKAAQDEIRDCGTVPHLISILGTPGAPEDATAAAVATVRFLALNSKNREVIRDAGGIPHLVALLRNQASSAVTVQVAAALTNLSRKKRSNMIAIAEAGGIPHLVSLLWQGSGSEAAMFSLSALTNLAYTSANRDAIREAGGIPALVHVLDSCCTAVAENTTLLGQVVAVLGNLAGTSKNRDAIREAGGLPLLVSLIDIRNPPEILGLAVSALTLLALSHTNADAVRREGAIPSLVLFLGSKSPSEDLTFKAAEAIRVLSAAPANRTALRDAGALEALVALLGPPGAPLRMNVGSSNADLLVEVILAVRNLVTSTRNQDTVRELGGVARLVEILRDPETSAREQLHGVSALVNLFAHNSTNREVVRVSGGIDAFVTLLKDSIASPDASKAELTAQAALALGFLARSDSNREAIRAAGGIPLLVQLLRVGPDAEVTLCAVDALRHVVATPANAKALLKAGGVSPLLKLLQAGAEHEVTHQSLWVLKVLSRSMASAEAIRAMGGLPLLVGLLSSGPDSEATIQAAAVLRDMADVDSDEGLVAIQDSGAIPSLVQLLQGGKEGLAGQALSASMAASALANLAQCPSIRESILWAGAVEPLIRAVQHPASESQVSVKACATLLNLSNSDTCRVRIIDAGAIPVLVGVLTHGQEADAAEATGSATVTTWATAVIASLARSEHGRTAIEHAGAVRLLVELLSFGPQSGPARQAAAAIQELSCSASGRECLTSFSAVPALVELHRGSHCDEELADCCIQGLTNLSRYPAARNELRNARAMDLLARGTNAVRRAVPPSTEAGTDDNRAESDLMHVPTGGWSWQQVGRQRDVTLSRLSSPPQLSRQQYQPMASPASVTHDSSA